MEQTAEAILGSDGYFRCQRFGCTMKREHCVSRQKIMLLTGSRRLRWQPAFLECQECRQGQEISGIKGVAGLKKKRKPGSRPGPKPTVSQEGVGLGFKRCYGCLQVKPKSEFYRSNRHLDGRQNKCKECVREEQRGRRRKG